MLIASWITKATNTDPDYVILFAFPKQQWLNESALKYYDVIHTYIACLVLYCVGLLDIPASVQLILGIYLCVK
jgi:hypothetical protein